MRRIFTKPYKNWPPEIKKQLYSANFRYDGFMRRRIVDYPNIDTFVMLDNGELIGWALVDPHHTAMFYVKRKYRRQGVAKKLGRRIKRKYRSIPIFMDSHDRASRALRRSLRLG